MGLPLDVRPCLAADVPEIVAVVNGAFQGEGGRLGWTSERGLVSGPRIDEPGLMAALVRPGSLVLVARAGGRAVGAVHVERGAGAVASIGMLSVSVGEQGGGVGRHLLAAAEKHAREAWGATTAVLHVISTRTELLAYYERRGYRRTGQTVPFQPRGDQASLQGLLAFERLEKRIG